MALSRNIPQAVASLKLASGNVLNLPALNCMQDLGIVGLGRIGSTVAKMAQAFGMVILGYDPYLSAEVAQKNGIKLVDLNEIYKTQIIYGAYPKTDETTGMISDAQMH